jgi:Domain of unknown function (DUF1735)
MKQIIALSLLLSTMAVAFSGCLKDKGFDNNRYGINDPDTQPPGVGFPLGANAKNAVGIDVSGTTQVLDGLVYVNLESGIPTPADVKITIANTTAAQVAAYNTANGTSIQVLPSALWTVATALTIPAGGRNVQVPLSVTNTLTLDPNISYAIGLTINSVDGGVKIADNLKNLFLVFGIKNAYDGKYTLLGQNYHPTAAASFPTFTTRVELRTTGPNTVKIFWPALGGYASPASLNGSLTAFAGQEPEITINTATSKVSVQNVATGATTFYTMGQGFNNAGYDHRWDPATKTIYANWGYNMGGGVFSPASSRAWIDTLIRTGPR